MTTAAELIAGSKALLLDFDGPMTALMPPPLNARAADQARAALRGVELPEAIATSTDHLAVLRFAAEKVPARLGAVEQSCTQAEIACSRTSEPSPSVRALVAEADKRGLAVAIVSNNSEAAVRVFLDRFDWASEIRTLACRVPGGVSRMKPNPYLVAMAARLVNVEPSACVLVGDSVADVEAGISARVPVIGWAKSPDRESQLVRAGAAAILWPHFADSVDPDQELGRD
jgi:phosphoglycolate phosphatase